MLVAGWSHDRLPCAQRGAMSVVGVLNGSWAAETAGALAEWRRARRRLPDPSLT